MTFDYGNRPQTDIHLNATSMEFNLPTNFNLHNIYGYGESSLSHNIDTPPFNLHPDFSANTIHTFRNPPVVSSEVSELIPIDDPVDGNIQVGLPCKISYFAICPMCKEKYKVQTVNICQAGIGSLTKHLKKAHKYSMAKKINSHKATRDLDAGYRLIHLLIKKND